MDWLGCLAGTLWGVGSGPAVFTIFGGDVMIDGTVMCVGSGVGSADICPAPALLWDKVLLSLMDRLG